MCVREVVGWVSVGAGLPDDESTVLVCNEQWDEPVWLGWCEHGDDGECRWVSVDCVDLDPGPTHWACVPVGVKHGGR